MRLDRRQLTVLNPIRSERAYRHLAALSVLIVTIAVLVFLLLRETRPENLGEVAPKSGEAAVGNQAAAQVSELTELGTGENFVLNANLSTALEQGGAEPSEDIHGMIASTDCRMLSKSREGRSFSVLAVPESTGARVVALDAQGRVSASISIPFVPNRMHVAPTGLSAPLMAFSAPVQDHSPNSIMNGGHQLRVLQGNGQIYAGEAVLDYGIASDGTSYFVVEALAGGSARLAVRDFERGSERHFDLDTEFDSVAASGPVTKMRYTLDETEIQLIPGGEALAKSYQFFPVRDSVRRRVVVQLDSTESKALFASSGSLYILSMGPGKESALIAKYGRSSGENWALDEQWSKLLNSIDYAGEMTLANEGDLLIVHGKPVPEVLWTETGEIIISSPIWPEDFHEKGDDAFYEYLDRAVRNARTPEGGFTYREDPPRSNRYLGVIAPPEPITSLADFPQFWDRVLDLDAEGYASDPEGTLLAGHPSPCRVAAGLFAGVVLDADQES